MSEDATITASAPAGGSVTATAVPPSIPAAEVKVVEHGEASDLPELDWVWRRAFVFALVAICALLVWRISERVNDVDTLKMTIKYLCWIILLLCLLYIAGASSEKIVQLVSAFRTTRKETITSGPPEAVPAVVAAVAGPAVSRAAPADPAATFNIPPWNR